MTVYRLRINFPNFLITTIAIALISGCSNEENKLKSSVVAQVGDSNISAIEFRLNYEFGFAHLKIMPDKKRSYLEFMINERLLSLEGYRLGLNKTERLQILEERLLEELLVEEMFKIEVDDKIEITPEEIKEAIAKSNVKWKLRYWVEPTIEASDHLYRSMQELGSGKISQKNPETGYFTWIDFPPEMLKKIEDLEIGEISEPVEYDDLFYLLQVTDIRMEGLSDYDYQSAYKRYEQLLFSRKIQEETAKYVSRFMTPKNVVTKGEEFRILADALAEWKEQVKISVSFSEFLDIAEESNPASALLKSHLENRLITFEDASWSLKDFINRFEPASIKTDPSNKHRYHRELNHQIAMSIRNHLLAKEAVKRGLDSSSEVQKQLRTWRDKWVYEEMRIFYTKNVKIDEAVAMNYFEEHKSRYKTAVGIEPTFKEFANQSRQYAYLEESQQLLDQKIEALKKEFRVRINQELLDSIVVIDFEKSRWANVLLFKGSSGRLAIPSVDPAWGWEANYN